MESWESPTESDEQINIDGTDSSDWIDLFDYDGPSKVKTFHPPPELVDVKSLPDKVQRRIKSLKKIHVETNYITTKFFHDVNEIETRYNKTTQYLRDMRAKIISGEYEPSDEECDFKEEDSIQAQNINVGDSKKVVSNDGVNGIPKFWLTIFKNVPPLCFMISEVDEPILEYLTNLDAEFHRANPTGYTLRFHFSPNPYFKNTVLTKTYEVKIDVDKDDAYSYEGPEIIRSQGCTIDWYEGKNVTCTNAPISESVPQKSFFHYFSPPDDPSVENKPWYNLKKDFEIGHFIRDCIVPKAILYYTGEIFKYMSVSESDSETDDVESETSEDYDDPFAVSNVNI